MRYDVLFSRRALADLDTATAWLTRRSPVGAARWRVALLSQIDTLERRPDRCPLADEAADLGMELRELLYGRRRGVYRILFTVDALIVHILRVRHAAQDRLAIDDV